MITEDDLHNKSTHSVLAFDNNRKGAKVNAQLLHQTIQSYQQKQLSKPLFWQVWLPLFYNKTILFFFSWDQNEEVIMLELFRRSNYQKKWF